MKVMRIMIATGLFLSGFSVGIIADISEAVINDSQVKASVYEDAIRNGVARQDTDGHVWWIMNNGDDVMAAFDP